MLIRSLRRALGAPSSPYACALALLVACGGKPEPLDERPNVLLISIDSLRADHLGAYGYARNTSPAIDGLAAEGVRFAKSMSSTSWTLPSHASLFTGLPNAGHGCSSKRPKLRPGATTLAERLQAAGYHTAGFWSGPYLHPYFGLAQGFDEYTDCTGFSYGAGRDALGQGEANRLSHRDVTNPKLTSSVLDWMQSWSQSQASQPFFLFVHMWDVHYDFFPPAPYDRMFSGDYAGPLDGTSMRKIPGKAMAPADMEYTRALYDGEIAWTDAHVGHMLARLEELGWKENTLVILTADHGEEFWERGDFGHRKTLFEESLAIPLVMRFPRAARAGVVVDAPTSIVDITPTILELAGLDFRPAAEHLAGVSLVPHLFGAGQPSERWLYGELARPKPGQSRVALRSGDWKLLFDPENDALLGVWDLSSDRGERNNRMHESTGPGLEIQEAARSAYAALRSLEARDLFQGSAGEDPDSMPQDVNAALNDLGYLGEDEDEEH